MTLPDHRPFTYLITTGQATDWSIVTTISNIISSVSEAVENGVSMVQLRENQLSGVDLFRLALKVSEITRGSGTRLFVNDRADIAVAAGADGVHLRSNSLDARAVRNSFGSRLMIGVSAHSVQDISEAIDDGADFAVFGPIFATPGKDRIVGLDELRSACSSSGNFPVIALGGVDESNYREALDAGAAGFAAIRSLNDRLSMMRIMRSIRPDLTDQ